MQKYDKDIIITEVNGKVDLSDFVTQLNQFYMTSTRGRRKI